MQLQSPALDMILESEASALTGAPPSALISQQEARAMSLGWLCAPYKIAQPGKAPFFTARCLYAPLLDHLAQATWSAVRSKARLRTRQCAQMKESWLISGSFALPALCSLKR